MKTIQEIIDSLSPVDPKEDALRTAGKNRGGAKLGTKRTEEQREKLRGRAWTVSAEGRANISAGVKKRIAIHGSNRKGIKMSEEQKMKLSLSQKGKPKPKHTDEQRERNRLAQLASKAVKLTCPHCGKSASKAMLVRWHGDNCKSLKV